MANKAIGRTRGDLAKAREWCAQWKEEEEERKAYRAEMRAKELEARGPTLGMAGQRQHATRYIISIHHRYHHPFSTVAIILAVPLHSNANAQS